MIILLVDLLLLCDRVGLVEGGDDRYGWFGLMSIYLILGRVTYI